MEIKSIADRIVKLSEKEGATQSEAYIIIAKTSSVYIDDNIPKIADVKTELGVGLKFVIGKKIGLTNSTLLAESPEDVVLRAKSIARISNEDEKFNSVPEPKKPSCGEDTFLDKKTAEADEEILLDMAMQVVESARSDKVTVPNGVLRASSMDFHVRNSLGVDSGSQSTIVFGHFTAKSEDNGKVGEGVQRCWSRKLSSIDFSKMGEKLNTQSMSVLDAKPFKEKWEDVVAVLAPSEGSEMLGQLVSYSASAENVNNRSSPWTDRVGDMVVHESLTLIDNGLSELGLLSSPVDDEGVPSQKTSLIEKGILKSYFYDSYNAAQVDLDATGNGIRRLPREAHGRFAIGTKCRVTTLEIPTKGKPLENVISTIKKGVYIEHFAWPQVDPISGSFSNEIRNARLIENGELSDQIKYALLVGNLYESLQKEILIGSDIQVNSGYVMPSLGFSGVELVGQ
ncbi:MAG: TldD/PmbA family protein [Candidatus Thorarchaeota archaeon]